MKLDFIRSAALVLAVSACAGPPPSQTQGADVVEVVFVHPERYVDAGEGPRELEANLKALERHLKRLGKDRLAAGQRLHVEVTELDLAGRVWPGIDFRTRPRVLNGGADWPRIDLHYRLQSGQGEVLRSGDVSLDDKTYLDHPLPSDGDPLRYEKRLLSQWFAGFQSP